MKQLNKSDNRIGSLDPEKVYFVEKFGYLIKKINGGYGNPVQNVLFNRINNAITDFKTDLPNIVYDLEVDRLKSIPNQKNKNIAKNISKTDKIESKSTVSKRATEATEIIRRKVNIAKKSVVARKTLVPVKKRIGVDRQSREYSQVIKNSNIILKPSIIEKEIDIPIDETLIPKPSSSAKKVPSSILRPSAATIREEQRLERIRALQESQKFVKSKVISKPTVLHSKSQPKQQLTEWERRWHKYDSDAMDEEFRGYS